MLWLILFVWKVTLLAHANPETSNKEFLVIMVSIANISESHARPWDERWTPKGVIVSEFMTGQKCTVTLNPQSDMVIPDLGDGTVEVSMPASTPPKPARSKEGEAKDKVTTITPITHLPSSGSSRVRRRINKQPDVIDDAASFDNLPDVYEVRR